MKRNSFILKCFSQFTCTDLDGSQKERGDVLNLLQKEGVTRTGGGSLRKGVVPTLEETMLASNDKASGGSNLSMIN